MSKIQRDIRKFKAEWNTTSTRRKLLWAMMQILLLAIYIPAIIFALKFGSNLDYQYSTYALLLAVFGYALGNIRIIKPEYQP